MPHTLTYAQAELNLAALHGALGEAQRGAFRSRLKHLKKLGVPRGVSPGKGAKVQYSDRHLFEWAFALELEEFGIDPSAIVRLMDEAWEDEILPRFHVAQHHRVQVTLLQAKGPAEDICLVLRPNMAMASWDKTVSPFSLYWPTAAELCDVVRDVTPDIAPVDKNDWSKIPWALNDPQRMILKSVRRRAIVINISRIVYLLGESSTAFVFKAIEDKDALAGEYLPEVFTPAADEEN
jgi:hypothetical protein